MPAEPASNGEPQPEVNVLPAFVKPGDSVTGRLNALDPYAHLRLSTAAGLCTAGC